MSRIRTHRQSIYSSKKLSISEKVLTSTLRSLERDGYVTRSVTPTIPPRVDYELSPLGHDVLIPVTALAAWAFERRDQVEAARAAFDHRDFTTTTIGATAIATGTLASSANAIEKNQVSTC